PHRRASSYSSVPLLPATAATKAAFARSRRRGAGDMQFVRRSHLNFVVELLAVRAGVRAFHDQRLHLVDGRWSADRLKILIENIVSGWTGRPGTWRSLRLTGWRRLSRGAGARPARIARRR